MLFGCFKNILVYDQLKKKQDATNKCKQSVTMTWSASACC